MESGGGLDVPVMPAMADVLEARRWTCTRRFFCTAGTRRWRRRSGGCRSARARTDTCSSSALLRARWRGSSRSPMEELGILRVGFRARGCCSSATGTISCRESSGTRVRWSRANGTVQLQRIETHRRVGGGEGVQGVRLGTAREDDGRGERSKTTTKTKTKTTTRGTIRCAVARHARDAHGVELVAGRRHAMGASHTQPRATR